jgi:vacuolar-type H+-ATPase subunit D/Vma8
MTVITPDLLREARAHAFREDGALPNSGQRREIVIIEAGWGSSGYYSEGVLGRDIPRIYPPGTHMYLDHPTVTEEYERPERSVKDLVAVTLETPRMAGIAAVTVCEIFEHWVPVIDALAEHIGVSIRALGVAEEGDAGGKHGEIVKSLTEGRSIDFVTMAGAGGQVGQLVESARERIRPLIESARRHSPPVPVKEALYSELRDALETAGEKRFAMEDSCYCYLEDVEMDEGWAIYSVRQPDPDTGKSVRIYLKVKFVRNEDGDVALSDDTEEVERETSWVGEEEDKAEDLASEALRLCESISNSDDEARDELREAEHFYDKFLEREISTDERIAMAEKGQAIPITNSEGAIIGGRFPMANAGDVKAAAMSIGRCVGQARIEAFINKVASTLSCPVPFKERGLPGLPEPKGDKMTEEERRRLQEAEDRVRELERKEADLISENGTLKTRAERAEEANVRNEASLIAAEAVGDTEGLSAKGQARAVREALAGDLPTDSQGRLDRDALAERARNKARDELEYLGASSERGRVRGIGESRRSDSQLPAGGDKGNGEGSEDELVEAFKEIGMPEGVAKLAAKGR